MMFTGWLPESTGGGLMLMSRITLRPLRRTVIGLHIVERRDGRRIEVQLRTARQHGWAEAIEVWGPTLGYNLKDGGGPDDLREYFAMAAERLAIEDRGEPPDPAIEIAFSNVRQSVLHYFD